MSLSREMAESFFWDEEEHLPTNFQYEAEFDIYLSGLCFQMDIIEMLLPSGNLVLKDLKLRTASDGNQQVGRPRKWDWEGALAFIISAAQHPDGLPTGDGAQARLEEMIANWFVSKTGDSPATSQIRQRASSIIRGITKA